MRYSLLSRYLLRRYNPLIYYFKPEQANVWTLYCIIDRIDRDSLYVRGKDGTGNAFLCPIDALIDPEDAEAALGNCVDSAVVERYAGNIKVVD